MCTLQLLERVERRARAEVDDLDRDVLAGLRPRLQQDVLRLEVAVHHLVLVAVHDRRNQALEDVGRLLFGELTLVHYVVEQFPARTQLRHDVKTVLVLVKLVDLYDVRVVLQLASYQLLQDLHLVYQLLLLLRRLVLLLDYLHRTDEPRLPVLPLPHLAERAFSYLSCLAPAVGSEGCSPP